ncbi:DNA ligase D [Bacillus sp. SM2101]|uniref:DNA ligase D n=1 Tax=Bacillus sp. SM2101 TaxID=2805366 RepID=UPI0020323E56|nr:DNA ligase D [Bacillus sp. SM2101]
MIRPMLPTLSFTPPKGEEWTYEVKYDGFRGLLFIDHNECKLMSRNGNNLLNQFPEIKSFVESMRLEKIESFLPLILDGEICILDSSIKANFSKIQFRGRLKDQERIKHSLIQAPAYFLVFDLLQYSGNMTTHLPYVKRKEQLHHLFSQLALPTTVTMDRENLIQLISESCHFDSLWNEVQLHNGEGLIAKQIHSKWEAGKRTTHWIKVKNWKIGQFFVTKYEKPNGYFHVGLFREGSIYEIGLFSHGLSPVERSTLSQVIQDNKQTETTQFVCIQPSICVELKYLEVYNGSLRQPIFSRFLTDLNVNVCTWEKLHVEQQLNQPESTSTTVVHVTNPAKRLWKERFITKRDYLDYLNSISNYMLPFLQNRLLTTIRYPHGMYGEKFYQKNCPAYAPDFVQTFKHEDITYIICNNAETLAWLGNQLAIEFHVPFNSIKSKGPSEIVFDLDPPSRQYFKLAVQAALLMKKIFDQLQLQSFVKTSGNKGLQVYIPLPPNTFSYHDTRLFTRFIANYLIENDPQKFTVERLKKKRENRLYIDYVQHAEGKTIIAPYSVRGNVGAYVATPLFWHEVNHQLKIEHFPMESIIERVTTKGCPLHTFHQVDNKQPFEQILKFLGSNKSLL